MRRPVLCVLGLSVASISAMPAVAQTAGGGGQGQPSDAASEARDGAPESGEIIVTARRVEERLQDVPVAVTALGARQLDNLSVTELRDLSSVAPSLNIKASSNAGQAALVSLRGQVPAGVLLSTDSAVGVYVDGYNRPRANGFRGALVDIARVEVLRGPQGTLYGRNTTGGAISVITNSPVGSWEGMAQLRLGNLGTASATAMVNVPLADGLAFRAVAQRGVSDGYGKDFDGRALANSNDTYLRSKLRLESGRFTAELSGEYQTAFSNGPIWRLSNLTQFSSPVGSGLTREAAIALGYSLDEAGYALALQALQPYIYNRGVSTDNSAFRSGSRDTYDRYWGYAAGLDMSLELSDSITLRSLTSYRYFKRRNAADYDGTPFDAIHTRYRINDEFLSEEFQILGNFDRLSFVAGIFASHETGYEASAPGVLQGYLASLNSPSYTTSGGYVTSKSLAAFAQVNYNLTDTLKLTLGGRYTKDIKEATVASHNNQDYIAQPLPLGLVAGCTLPASLRDAPSNCRAHLKNSFSDPSWLVSLDWKVTPDVLTYAKVARGFRAGGQNIRGTNLVALQPFGPETITEYEIGLKSEWFDRTLGLNIAAFHDDYSGVQRTVAVFQNNVSASLVTNAAEANIDGIEVETWLRPTRGLTLSANVSYTKARYVTFVDATGDRSNEDWPTPAWTYAFSARYVVPVGPNELAAQVDYQGQSAQNLYPAVARQPEDVRQAGYGLLNARLSYRIDSQDLEIALFGKNLTDKVYADSALSLESGLGFNIISIAAPRTFGLELTKRF